MKTAAQLAEFFHRTYEELAPTVGYETRKESAKPWDEVPLMNRELMIVTCQRVIEEILKDFDIYVVQFKGGTWDEVFTGVSDTWLGAEQMMHADCAEQNTFADDYDIHQTKLNERP